MWLLRVFSSSVPSGLTEGDGFLKARWCHEMMHASRQAESHCSAGKHEFWRSRLSAESAHKPIKCTTRTSFQSAWDQRPHWPPPQAWSGWQTRQPWLFPSGSPQPAGEHCHGSSTLQYNTTHCRSTLTTGKYFNPLRVHILSLHHLERFFQFSLNSHQYSQRFRSTAVHHQPNTHEPATTSTSSSAKKKRRRMGQCNTDRSLPLQTQKHVQKDSKEEQCRAPATKRQQSMCCVCNALHTWCKWPVECVHNGRVYTLHTRFDNHNISTAVSWADHRLLQMNALAFCHNLEHTAVKTNHFSPSNVNLNFLNLIEGNKCKWRE